MTHSHSAMISCLLISTRFSTVKHGRCQQQLTIYYLITRCQILPTLCCLILPTVLEGVWLSKIGCMRKRRLRKLQSLTSHRGVRTRTRIQAHTAPKSMFPSTVWRHLQQVQTLSENPIQHILNTNYSSAHEYPTLYDPLTIWILGIESLRRKIMSFKFSEPMPSDSS